MESFSGRAWRKKRKPLPRLKRKSSGGGFRLALNECFDELSDFVLLMTWKLTGPLKNLTQLPNWSFATRLGGVTAKEVFDGHIEQAGHLLDLVRSQRDRVTLPNAVGGLSDAHLLGNLRLAQARRFTRSVQARAERRARFFGWSAGLHDAIVTRRRNS